MPASQVQTFTLAPHTAVDGSAVHGIQGRVSRTAGGLRVRYVLAGDLERLCVPASQAPRFADELWRHTCFEIFIARKGEPRYLEFNFSPSGEWAVYAFARYREPVPPDAGVALAAIEPRITVRRSTGKLELDAMVQLDRLSLQHADARLVLGLSAVVEASDGPDLLSYWALRHPVAKPDFHHPDAFVLEL